MNPYPNTLSFEEHKQSLLEQEQKLDTLLLQYILEYDTNPTFETLTRELSTRDALNQVRERNKRMGITKE